MKILVLDNYDSFTYNLVHMIKSEEIEVEVFRNDKITAEQCTSYDGIVLSPGPGIPSESGNMPKIISNCASHIPMLGICLGHQAIGEYLGAKLINLDKVYHGIQSKVRLEECESEIFNNIENIFEVGRYHSWTLSPDDLRVQFEVTAKSDEGHIMAIENKSQNLYGLQFHPESILTPSGKTIINNFLQLIKKR